jgi:hypothetical protein
MELPSEVGGGAAYDVVTILVHIQEGAVLAAILPELQIERDVYMSNSNTPEQENFVAQNRTNFGLHNLQETQLRGRSREYSIKPYNPTRISSPKKSDNPNSTPKSSPANLARRHGFT